MQLPFLPRPGTRSEQNQIAPRHREYRDDFPQPRNAYDLIAPLGRLANVGAITGVVGLAMSHAMNTTFSVPVYLGDSLAVGAPETITDHPGMILTLLGVSAAGYAATRCVEIGAERLVVSKQARRSTATRSQEFIKQIRTIPGNAIGKLVAYPQRVSTETTPALETE